ncbi:MAG: DUF2934 domain-containing protein [Beijerinckiaceae bacterium]|jgi:hypothetical protein
MSEGGEFVRLRAYQLWQAAGAPEGKALEFWLEAERELQNSKSHVNAISSGADWEEEELQEGLMESFPASDPPAAIQPHHGKD